MSTRKFLEKLLRIDSKQKRVEAFSPEVLIQEEKDLYWNLLAQFKAQNLPIDLFQPYLKKEKKKEDEDKILLQRMKTHGVTETLAKQERSKRKIGTGKKKKKKSSASKKH